MHKCNGLYVKHDCIASCGIIDSKLEIALDIRGCNLNCKYCWGQKMRHAEIKKSPVQVVEDVLCRAHHTLREILCLDPDTGVVRITGNEPTLQWRYLLR